MVHIDYIVCKCLILGLEFSFMVQNLIFGFGFMISDLDFSLRFSFLVFRV